MGAGGCGRVHEWEAGLPTVEELTPLSHPLIPPALAAAFRINVVGASSSSSPFGDRDSPDSHLLRLREGDGPGAACKMCLIRNSGN
ncbi:hypothetical protein EJB05_18745, partial [Eragrostis curvula]